MKYSVITFGCRVNQADSLGFEEELRLRGATAAASPEDADVVIVNTCSVTSSADQGGAANGPTSGPHQSGGEGCRDRVLRDAAPDEFSGLTNVLRVVPNGDKSSVVSLLAADLGLTTSERFGDGEGSCGSAIEPGVAGRTAFTLRVQTGCAQPCAYCIIPTTRGEPRSVRPDGILSELDRIAGAGFKEIALTGVHLGSYGRDLRPASSLIELLRALEHGAVPRLPDRLASGSARSNRWTARRRSSISWRATTASRRISISRCSTPATAMLTAMRRPYTRCLLRRPGRFDPLAHPVRLDRVGRDCRVSRRDRRRLRGAVRVSGAFAADTRPRLPILRSPGDGRIGDGREGPRRGDPGTGGARARDRSSGSSCGSANRSWARSIGR